MNKSNKSNGASVGTNNDSCVFCKIAEKQIPASIVFEDNISIAFLDINPVSDGHILLIPKSHYTQLSETPDDLVGELFKRIKYIMSKLKEAMNADFVAMTVVGTDVPHLHIHLIPRKENDGLAGFWPTKKYESEHKKIEVSEKIKSSLEK